MRKSLLTLPLKSVFSSTKIYSYCWISITVFNINEVKKVVKTTAKIHSIRSEPRVNQYLAYIRKAFHIIYLDWI